MCEWKNNLTVIGGGTAGCQAALYGAKNGLEVTLYEQGRLGGTCLHIGCMPTKALLHAPDRPWADLMRQIRGKLELLESGMAQQLRRAGVRICRQPAPDVLPETGAVILATGALRAPLPQIPGKQVCGYDTILQLETLPQELAIIGAGVSGLEYAQIFASLGCRVTVHEQAETILPGFPEHCAGRLMEICLQEGIEFVCAEQIDAARIPQEHILWTGRTAPWPQAWIGQLAAMGIRAEADGIVTDAHWQTSRPGVYAIGDCVAGSHTAYTALQAARMAVDDILGRPSGSLGVMPQVVCGWYDLFCVGQWDGLSAEARMDRSGYAFLQERMDGFVRLVCDPETGVLTGAQLLCPGAAETGSLLAAAINARMPVQTLAQTLFFHPAYMETIKDAAVELYDLYRKQHN